MLLYDLNGKFRSSFGKRGDGASEFNFPIALASKNGLHIVDAMNYRVQNFTPSGTFLNAIGRQGTVTGTFASPKSVALDSDGNIYVTDALMDCFQIFNTQGQLLLVVGKNGKRDGEFVGPNGIAINGKDQIYVVDGFNKRIQIFQYIK